MDLFWPNLPGTGTGYIIPGQGEFGKWHPGWERESAKPFFTVYTVHSILAVTHKLFLKKRFY